MDEGLVRAALTVGIIGVVLFFLFLGELTLGEIADLQEPDLPSIERRLAQGATAEYNGDWVPLDVQGRRVQGCRCMAPLCVAAYWDHIEVERTGGRPGAADGLVWKVPGNGMTALHQAAKNGHAGVVLSLAARGRGSGGCITLPETGITPLPPVGVPLRRRCCWRPGRRPRSETSTATLRWIRQWSTAAMKSRRAFGRHPTRRGGCAARGSGGRSRRPCWPPSRWRSGSGSYRTTCCAACARQWRRSGRPQLIL